MALKIRLRQQGRTNRTTYRLVVTDARSPRDGKYVEAIGWYNPIEAQDDKNLLIKEDRLLHWLNVGAELSDRAAALVARAAPHIMRQQVEKQLAHRVKMAAKRRAPKQATG